MDAAVLAGGAHEPVEVGDEEAHDRRGAVVDGAALTANRIAVQRRVDPARLVDGLLEAALDVFTCRGAEKGLRSQVIQLRERT